MDNIFGLASEVLSLARTIEEGLEHLNKRMGELHFEDTRYLFQDIAEAYRSILATLENRPKSIADTAEILEKSTRLQLAFEKMNQSYEDNKLDEARMDLQFILLPAFRGWMQELENYLRVSN